MEGISYKLPFKPLTIRFMGDLQWLGEESGNTAVGTLKDDIHRVVERDERIIGMGDMTDFLSPSNRAKLLAAGFYDTAIKGIDGYATSLTQDLYKVLKPTKGKWLGMVEGHHFHQYRAGMTSDMELAKLLDATFLGTSAIIRLVFEDGRKQIPVTIFVHHGVGQGQTGYYPVARLEKVAAGWEEVDIFAMGHTCKIAVEATQKVRPRWIKGKFDLTHRKILLVGTGGYSKTYREGVRDGGIPRGGYAEQKMYNPVILGSPVVRLTPVRLRENYSDHIGIEITAEA